MDPLVFVLIVAVTILVIGGVWGLAIVQGLMKQRALKLERRGEDPRIGEIQEGHRLLEARVEQLEEEVGFFRELHRPDAPPQLSSPEEDAT